MLLTFIATGATAIVIRDRGPSHREVFCQNRLPAEKILDCLQGFVSPLPSFPLPLVANILTFLSSKSKHPHLASTENRLIPEVN